MRAIRLARERTFEQDPKYPIRLLVDIAIRALSPAINDPTTAVQTIDQLEDLLRRLGQYDLDAGHASDANGVVRLVFPMPTWEDYLALAFDEIRQYGSTSVQVMRRLRSALVGLIESTVERRSDRRGAAVSRAPRPRDRSLDARRQGSADGPPGGSARAGALAGAPMSAMAAKETSSCGQDDFNAPNPMAYCCPERIALRILRRISNAGDVCPPVAPSQNSRAIIRSAQIWIRHPVSLIS